MSKKELAGIEPRLFEGLVADPCGELPSSLDEAFLVEELAKREQQLESVDTALTTKVRASYDGFVKAMQLIRSLEEASTSAAVVASASRGHLKGLENEMAVPALRMLKTKRRLERNKALLECCEQIAVAREKLARARVLLDRFCCLFLFLLYFFFKKTVFRQQFRECLNLLAELTSKEKTGPVALKLLCQGNKWLFLFWSVFVFDCVGRCSRAAGRAGGVAANGRRIFGQCGE